jgi:predicted dienelactone hydrolase
MRSAPISRAVLLLSATLLLAPDAGFAADACDAYASHDRPQLAAPGEFPVGRRTLTLESAGGTGPSGATPRSLGLMLWYPASVVGCTGATPWRQTLERHAWRPFATPSVTFDVAAAATPDAPPAAGPPRPLVVLSHGLLGWGSAFTYLGEHLASRGYVVAAIDHGDERPGPADPLRSAMVHRPADQAAAIAALRRWNSDPDHVLHRRIDPERVALVGYSMGGYGALHTASAAGGRGGLRAVVAIAPWGGQSHVRAFDPAVLRGIAAPLLFIAGDHDDVSGFEDGVRTLAAGATGTERWLLTYQNARHNVGGYPLADFAVAAPVFRSFFVDPVWRIDRIQAVNRHFITAFLDLALRDDATRRGYLEPPVARSNDGRWPVADPFDLADPVADAATAPEFWPGFGRRSALGLELQHLERESP